MVTKLKGRDDERAVGTEIVICEVTVPPGVSVTFAGESTYPSCV